MLVEGAESGDTYHGRSIPLAAAHDYRLYDPSTRRCVERYLAADEDLSDDCKTRLRLLRYRVEGDQLVRFSHFVWEESTFDMLLPGEGDPQVVLRGLVSLPDGRRP